MDNETLRKKFWEDGYMLLPGVLSAEETVFVRQELEKIFSQPAMHEHDSDIRREYVFDRYPQLRWLLHLPKVTNTLKILLGDDYGVFPKTAIINDSYYFKKWHRDTSYLDTLGYQFHRQPDFRVINTIIYLQENDDLYGGGLDLFPGTHLTNEEFFSDAHQLIQAERTDFVRIKNKPGDMIIFDLRIGHRSTPAKQNDPRRKFTLSCWCSSNNEHIGNLSNTANHHRKYINVLLAEFYQKLQQIDPRDQQTAYKLREELIYKLSAYGAHANI